MKRLTLLITFTVICYPLLSLYDIFPHQQLIEITESFDVGRGQSLAFRFFHESRLLDHAQQKYFFGWGGWGRGFLPDSVTDGFWIIIFAEYGILGFGAFFGLVILSGWRGVKSAPLLNTVYEQRLMVGHALMVFLILADQLPNHSLHSWLWFFIGALLGRANHVFKEQKTKMLK